MRQISVIIPSYNSFSTIARTVQSVLEQNRPELLKEIVLVDSSDDGKTPEVLQTLSHPKLRVIRLAVKTMPAIGRNLGAKEASGELLAFIDSDAYAAQDWLEKIVEAYEQGVHVGGGAILLPEFQQRKAIAVAQYYLQFNEFMGGARRTVFFTPSCNLFCEKTLFDRVGGFPEIRASEDVLFGLKVSKNEKFYFEPGIRVYHIFRENQDSYYRNQRMLGEYILIYRRDHLKTGWCHVPWLPALVSPAVVLLKFFMISGRVFRYGGFRSLGHHLSALPMFLVGLVQWGVGFASASREGS